MKRLIILALVVSFMIISSGAPAVFAAEAKTAMGAVTLQGVLQEGDSGYVIKSGKATHVVVGDGLDKYVGKKVVATGKMTKSEKGRVFQVQTINEQMSKKK